MQAKKDKNQMKMFMGIMLSMKGNKKGVKRVMESSSNSEVSSIDSADSPPTKRMKKGAGKTDKNAEE